MENPHDPCPCTKGELELFNSTPTDISLEHGFWSTHRPISSLSDNVPLEFNVPATADYIDIGRTQLHLKVKIVNTDGTNIAEDAKVSTCNLFLHSLFSQADLKLNGKLISPSTNTYPYRAYLETLLSHGGASKGSWLQCEMFYNDRPPGDSFDHTADGANPGLVKRANRIKNSKIVEMIGRPHFALMFQDKYLLNHVELSLKMIQSPKAFHLIGPDVSGFRVEFIEAALLIRKCKVNPTISLQHAKMLDDGINAQYPIRRGLVNSFTISTGSLSVHRENLITGQLPRRVVIALCTNSAFNGHSRQNPFFFQNFQLNYICLHSGSESYPTQPLKPNYRSAEYVKAFHDLYMGTGVIDTSSGLDIDLDCFNQGHTIYCFDLTPDLCDGSFSQTRFGNLRLELRFDTATQSPLNCLTYFEFDNVISIDRSRNILLDYSPS